MNNIHFLGYVTDEQKFAYLKSAKLFLAPSHEEGWGIAVSEAMACGIPVAGYKLDAYEMVFGDSIHYAPCFDKNELASRALELLDSVELSEKFIKKGYQVASNLNWKDVFSDEINFIALMNCSNKPARAS